MKRALIDTNIYSLALRGDAEIVTRLRELDEIGISVISLGELEVGFRAGNRYRQNKAELFTFLDSPRVRLHVVDSATTEFYATAVLALRSAGTPIPTNDIWIAAVALRHGLPIFTRDAHFARVPGLLLLP